ncbi:hypothetical protein B7R22_16995 [Subtercola boreus]|uniref:Uncharacterized protein n=1 Tax=Subtercola boreus TaxID=120213 RepID=A0A3E0VRQ5_9MICO|nr:hypothetical protein [Subtercola boreus]RFA12128.1 hypothetical protein B7R22_16995 [Subtercola boreus]
MTLNSGTPPRAESTPATPQSWTFDLGYAKPPPGLSMNDRTHFRKRAASTSMIRDFVVWRCREVKVPKLQRIRVDVQWVVRTNGRRDTDNLAPLLKAIYDGVGADKGTSAHIVPDDAPAFMEKPEASIRLARLEQSRFVVTITDLGAAQ